MSVTTSKKKYKAKLSYKKEWEIHYPWLHGMFCKTCQKYGNAPAGCRGAWTTRGVKDWNHATDLLKQHMVSQWHTDAAVTAAAVTAAAVTAAMAEQAESGGSVLELECSSAAREAAE